MVRLDRITMQGFKSFANRITIPFPSGFNVICGPNGSGKSCRGDTQVLLSTGETKEIKYLVDNALEKSSINYKLDDGVMTLGNPDSIKIISLNPVSMKAEEKPVLSFVRREGEPNLYKITTKNGKSVVTTSCHPIMIFKDGEVKSELVRNLREGQFIATPRIIGTCNKTSSVDGIEINESFARFFGYLIGDGYMTYNRFEFINAEENILEDFESLANSLFKKNHHYKKLLGKATRLIYWDSKLPETFRSLLKAESVRKMTGISKVIPEEIMLSSNDVVANFLAGLFDCDGTVRKDNPTFEYTTKSQRLADQVQLSLLRFGITARKEKKIKVATNTVNKKRGEYFYIIIEGHRNLKTLLESIPMRCEEKKKRLEYFSLKQVKYNTNSDIIPQEANKMIKDCAKTLRIKPKLLRKTYPRFTAYIEDRCCPSREGLELVIKLLEARSSELENALSGIEMDQVCLLSILSTSNIYMHEASESIGLSRDSINCHWARGKKASPENLQKFHDFLLSEITNRVQMSKKTIKSLKTLASSEIFWDEIKSIEEVKGEKYVYDLCIDGNRNFIGNGIFVHNSNVIDALLFVLGTSSARSIRAMKLQNLLFNGARDKKSADFCEVSIYVDNSDGKIPGDEKEIKITRRVTRSGISIYKMNGRTVTRSKILDTLAYANLSSEGYNIIMQGDVTKIIEMSPAERKGVIDEISGISEFDEKKEKATRELEKVETRVRENMIIVAEKQKLVSRLKQEKENAEKYSAIEAELRKSKASLLRKKIKDLTEKQSTIDKEINENTKNFDMRSKEFTKIDDDLEKKEKGVLRKSDELVQKSRNYDIMRNIDKINNEILRKRDRISYNERELERIRGASENRIVRAVMELKRPGVYGTVSSLVEVPKKYSIALEVAIGRHKDDIVVDSEETASYCIKQLKERKLGRARFIPLTKMINRPRKKYDGRSIGYAIDLIKFEHMFLPAFEYVLGSTLVVDNIDTAKKIRGFRVVTLDGDMVEIAGAMIGGFYRKHASFGGENFIDENGKLEEEIEKLEAELEKLRGQEEKESGEVVKLQEAKTQEEKDLDMLRKRRKELYEERMVMQSVIGRAKVEKAKFEASMDNLAAEFAEFKDVQKFFEQSIEELQERVRRCLIEINQIGPVNMKAIEEFATINVEFEELRKKLDKLLEEKDAVMNIVADVEKRRYDKFMETFSDISQNFSRIYRDMTNGDGVLRLEVENNIDSGLMIEANPSGKRIINLDAMSGGEKTMTSLAFLFAVMQHYQAPFYVLDEIDAALDKANTRKMDNLIKKYSKAMQFIVITHNDLTIAEADKVFGVSMEGGVSKVFGIEMPAARG